MKESFTAEVISLGRITIPKTIRDILDVSDGDYVKISIEKFRSIQPEALQVSPKEVAQIE